MTRFVKIHYSLTENNPKTSTYIINTDDIARIRVLNNDNNIMLLKTNPFDSTFYIDDSTLEKLEKLLVASEDIF